MIDAKRVREIFMECLFTNEQIEALGHQPKDGDYIKAPGITRNVGFNPDAIKSHKEEISQLVDGLDEKFKEGYSFLAMCFDKDGNHWGEHINCEQLIQLGIAIGRMDYCFPREMWPMLPGSVPYIIVKA